MNRGMRAAMAVALLAACAPPQPSLSAHTAAGPVQVHPVAATASGGSRLAKAVPTQAAHADSAAPAIPSGLRVRTVRQFAWGSGPSQLGHVHGGEQNPEAPMALDVDAQGSVYILDQVNERVLITRRDGTLAQVPAPRTAQDLLVATPQLWLLDRLVGRELQRVDLSNGALLQTLPLTAVAEPGTISALWAHAGDLYAELGHSELVRLAQLQGASRPQLSVFGRPTPDGLRRLTAARVVPNQVTVQVRRLSDADDAPPVRALQATLPSDVQQIVELAADAIGRIWLVVDLGDAAHPVRQALMWEADFSDPRRADLAPWRGPEETLRPARLAPSGHLFALGLTADGLSLQEVAP